MSSIKDIARISKTSPATVSRVLNNSGYVGKDARRRVEAAVAELDYRPNAGARQMRSGISQLVGILLPSIDVSFFGILGHAIEQELFEKGYNGLICSTAENEEHEARYVSTLLSQNVDGIIVASAFSGSRHFERVAQQGIPIVAIDRALNDLPQSSVSVDHIEGGRIMAQHLIDLGHKNIGIIGAPGHSQPIEFRINGIMEILSANGLKPTHINLGSQHSFSECFKLAEVVLSDGERPTAIIGLSDIAAMSCINAAHNIDLKVPQDISVIGFDDLPEAAYLLPGLTTVKQPIRQLGRTAVKQLLSIIDPKNNPEPKTIDLPLELIIRGSTAKPYSS